jgi:hypothetical protein
LLLRKQRSEGLQFKASSRQIVCEPLSKKKKKNPLQKRAGGVAQGVGPEFKPQNCKKNQKKLLTFSFSLKFSMRLL